jgi:hypothetical protein
MPTFVTKGDAEMKRTVAAVLVAVVATLGGAVATPPGLPTGVAHAQTTEKQLMEQLARAKKMVADLEMKLASKKMAMDAMSMDKTMKMLMDVNKMLEDLGRQSP